MTGEQKKNENSLDKDCNSEWKKREIIFVYCSDDDDDDDGNLIFEDFFSAFAVICCS